MLNSSSTKAPGRGHLALARGLYPMEEAVLYGDGVEVWRVYPGGAMSRPCLLLGHSWCFNLRRIAWECARCGRVKGEGRKVAWETVATAQVDSSGVQGDIPRTLEELPAGTLGLFRLQAWGLGPVFDAPGVELVVQGVFNAQGLDAQVIDCWGEGWSTAYIKFQGSPVLVVPLVWAISAALAALAFLAIAVSVSVLVWRAAAGVPGALLTLAILGGLVLGGIYLTRRQPERARR